MGKVSISIEKGEIAFPGRKGYRIPEWGYGMPPETVPDMRNEPEICFFGVSSVIPLGH
jgi:hypothetical protein